jgi:Beta-galactosidase
MPSMLRAVALIALAAALAAAAVPAATAAPRKVPHGFHGVMWDRAARNAPEADLEQQWSLMAQSGVESVRTVFSWARAQPTEGVAPDLSGTDALVSRAARHNIKLLPIVIDTPDWAAKRPGTGAPPAHVGAYTAFLRTLVLRYGPRGAFWEEHPELPRRPLREWQIWNEPHLDF